MRNKCITENFPNSETSYNEGLIEKNYLWDFSLYCEFLS